MASGLFSFSGAGEADLGVGAALDVSEPLVGVCEDGEADVLLSMARRFWRILNPIVSFHDFGNREGCAVASHLFGRGQRRL